MPDQFPASTGSDPVIARLDQFEWRCNARLERFERTLEAKIEQVRSDVLTEMHRALRQQTILMLTTIIAVVGFVASTSAFG